MNGIKEIADSLSAELKRRLPKQRNGQNWRFWLRRCSTCAAPT
jgi:hypothetical protein